MVSLAPQYVQEGLRIRSTYIALADEFDVISAELVPYEQEIGRVVKELDELEHAELTNDSRMREFHVIVADLQRAHERVKSKFLPHEDAMAQLRRDAQKLQELLQERYPGTSTEEFARALAAAYEAQ
jgi:hypothetical protein